MRLQALTRAENVRGDCFSGTVDSVFRQAMNVRIDDGTWFSLLAADLPNAPWSVRVAVADGFSFQDHVGVACRVACRGGILRVQGAAMAVDLRPSVVWGVALAQLRADLTRPDVRRAWRMARRGLGRSPGFRLPVAGARRKTRFAHTACGLIGAGPGLTPAGDDFLVGFLGGLWSTCGDAPDRHSFLANLGRDIVLAARRTVAVSRAYLVAAADGLVSQPLVDFAAVISAGGEGDSVRPALCRITAMGATSGRCAGLGLLAGMAYWYRPQFHPTLRGST